MTLMEIIQDTAFKSPVGSAALAEHLSKAQSTLYNELNPNPADNRTHKLGLLDWLQIVRLTGDHRSLHKVCAELGHVAVPVPACHLHRTDWLKMAAADAREHGEAAATLLGALSGQGPAGDKLTREERRACAQEYYEAARAALTIWEALRDED
jgi:hypothetical protein